ncbi:MAG: PrsW family intramembrane metalloprotease [Erysipelotrichaceae bacterium]|nr:PrsW family intramembrane metalloprotease [Erysipelotrichaceae bacterium]
MSYIENIFVCIAAPLLIAIICISSRGRRPLLFVLGGMTMCLLSSYISTFVAAVQGADLVTASLEITPLVEEIMKLLPFLFYMLVFEPGKHTVLDSLLMTAIGFATFENICYLSQNGAENFFYLLIRGFGTGAMHVICEAFIGLGILYLWDRKLIQVAGTVGLLAIAITFHGIYNILVSQTGIPARIGYIMPLITTLFIAFYGNRHAR